MQKSILLRRWFFLADSQSIYFIIAVNSNKDTFFIIKFYLCSKIIFGISFAIEKNYKLIAAFIFSPTSINFNNLSLSSIAYNIKTSVNPISKLQIHMR